MVWANTLALSGDYRTPRELYLAGLADYPVEDSTLSEEEKEDITIHSLNAGYVMGYISAVQYIDQQIGRVISMVASDPVLSENTIIILISDHGYALGEKPLWQVGPMGMHQPCSGYLFRSGNTGRPHR